MNGRANMQTGHQHCTCWPSQVAHCQPRRPVCAAQRRNRDAPVFQQDFEVPQAGWMWDAGKAAATKKSLKAANIKAKKSLGQNFCTDDNILADIVTAARVTPSDVVIEVGPGTGNLTRHLIATQAPVLAIEKDDTLIESLREEFKEVPNLQLVHGDVMRLDLQQLVSSFTAEQPVAADTVRQATCSSSSSSRSRSHGSNTSNTNSSNGNGSSSNTSSQSVVDDSITESSIDSSTNGAAAPSKRLKVVANLPYNITKDFLLALLPQGDVVSELSIMIQQEVADRLIDPTPGRHNYRAMSVLTHYYSKPVYRFRIPKEKYFPVPGVDGALVTFRLLPPSKRLKVAGEKGFVSMISKAFSERRKMLRNTLQPLYLAKEVEAALDQQGIRPDARAQELSVAHFAAVYNTLQAARVS